MNQSSETPTPCPLCQGQRVWAKVAGGDDRFLLTYGYARTRFVLTAKQTKVTAAICLTCGFTAFYAKDVQKVREDFQQHPEWFEL